MPNEEVVDCCVDEVDDLDRRVDDPEGCGRLREGFAEEFLVELGDDTLTACGGVDSADEHPDVVIELFQGGGLGPEVDAVEYFDH